MKLIRLLICLLAVLLPMQLPAEETNSRPFVITTGPAAIDTNRLVAAARELVLKSYPRIAESNLCFQSISQGVGRIQPKHGKSFAVKFHICSSWHVEEVDDKRITRFEMLLLSVDENGQFVNGVPSIVRRPVTRTELVNPRDPSTEATCSAYYYGITLGTLLQYYSSLTGVTIAEGKDSRVVAEYFEAIGLTKLEMKNLLERVLKVGNIL